MGECLDIIRNMVLLIILILAAYDDLRYGKIRNAIILPAVLNGIIIEIIQSPYKGLLSEAKALSVMFAIAFVLYLIGFIGVGDGKLLLAVAALKGLPFSLGVTIYAILICALINVYYIIKNKSFSESWKRFADNIKGMFLSLKLNKSEAKVNLPAVFALAVFIGTAVEWVVPFIDTLFIR